MRCATIYGSVLTTCAPITRHGIITTACKAPPSKPRYAAHTTWERPSWKFATGGLATGLPTRWGCLILTSATHLNRVASSAEERAAWDTLKLSPVDDLAIVKKQYKQLVKENHPDKNGGDARAEERLKEINLAFSLIRKNLTKGSKTAAF